MRGSVTIHYNGILFFCDVLARQNPAIPPPTIATDGKEDWHSDNKEEVSMTLAESRETRPVPSQTTHGCHIGCGLWCDADKDEGDEEACCCCCSCCRSRLRLYRKRAFLLRGLAFLPCPPHFSHTRRENRDGSEGEMGGVVDAMEVSMASFWDSLQEECDVPEE